DPIREALNFLPRVLAAAHGDHDAPLPSALLYYKVSTAEFAFLGDSIGWALSDEGRQSPESRFERTQVEQAFQNAWKALEALLGGEPPTDDRRFRERLQAVGVDPDYRFGHRSNPEALVDVLKRMRGTRDTRAAHGGRTSAKRRGIAPFELMEAQFA